MGLRRVININYSHKPAQNQTQGGQCIVGTLLVLKRTTSNSDSQDSPRPGLGGSHHLPPCSILCASPQGPPLNGILSPEIAKVGTHVTLGLHNFTCRPSIEMKSKKKLQPLSRAFKQCVAQHLHTRKLGRFPTFSGQKSNYQFDS